jgi:hypothetical protein
VSADGEPVRAGTHDDGIGGSRVRSVHSAHYIGHVVRV